MRRFRAYVLLWFVVACIVVYGQEKRAQSATDGNHAKAAQHPQSPSSSTPTESITVVQQETPQNQEHGAEDKPHSYFRRLFSPENLPNIGLFVAGLIGIGVALGTLREMGHQRSVMQGQLDAMKGQIGQMEASGMQTGELIKHATEQTNALSASAKAASDMAETARITATVSEGHAAAAAASAKAAQVSTGAFIHSQRPWITLQVGIASPLTWNEDGTRITLNVTLENIGHMPAEGVWLHPVLSVKSDQNAERKQICAGLSPQLGGLGQVVFPGQTWVQNWGISVGSIEIEARCREIFPNLDIPPFVPFSVIVAVQYTTGIDPAAILYTAAIYDLRRIENGIPLLVKYGETIPASSLYLQLSGLAGVIAK